LEEAPLTKIFFVLVALFLAGCSQTSSSTTPLGGVPKVTGKDITNRAMCKGAANKNASIYVQGWEAVHLRDDGAEVTTKIYFFGDKMSLHSFCKRDGLDTYAYTSAEATVADGQVKVARVLTAIHADVRVHCEANIMEHSTMAYNFEGACLRLTNPDGSSLVLIPR